MADFSDKVLAELKDILKRIDIPIEILEGFELQSFIGYDPNTLLEKYERIRENGDKILHRYTYIIAPVKFYNVRYPLFLKCYCNSNMNLHPILTTMLDDLEIVTKQVEKLEIGARMKRQDKFELEVTANFLGTFLTNWISYIITHL